MKLNLVLILLTTSLFAQGQERDTVYIFFDETHENMRKVALQINEDTPFTIGYKIREKKTENEWGDVFFNFSHQNFPKASYKNLGGRPSETMVRDVIFLTKWDVLTTHFFARTDYTEVIKVFESDEGFNSQDVVIFIIDKAEICNGHMVLREVYYSRPVKE